MVPEALQNFEAGGAFRAVRFLARQTDEAGLAANYSKLVTEAYWTKKCLPDVIVIGTAGVQYMLSAVARHEATDPVAADDFKTSAIALLYNLASFTWDGWAEAGITVDATAKMVGMAAALAHLELAEEEKRPAYPIRRAHWIVAAHYLSQREHAASELHFRRSAELASGDAALAEALLAEGFASLNLLLQEPASTPDQERLASLIQRLKELPDGDGLAAQITTAHEFYLAQHQV